MQAKVISLHDSAPRTLTTQIRRILPGTPLEVQRGVDLRRVSVDTLLRHGFLTHSAAWSIKHGRRWHHELPSAGALGLAHAVRLALEDDPTRPLLLMEEAATSGRDAVPRGPRHPAAEHGRLRPGRLRTVRQERDGDAPRVRSLARVVPRGGPVLPPSLRPLLPTRTRRGRGAPSPNAGHADRLALRLPRGHRRVEDLGTGAQPYRRSEDSRVVPSGGSRWVYALRRSAQSSGDRCHSRGPHSVLLRSSEEAEHGGQDTFALIIRSRPCSPTYVQMLAHGSDVLRASLTSGSIGVQVFLSLSVKKSPCVVITRTGK